MIMNKILLVTNILTPYRSYFYSLLHHECVIKNIDLKILVTADNEPNRNWKYEDFKQEYTILVKGKIFSFPNNIFIHLNNIIPFLKDFKPSIVICAGTYLYPALWQILTLKKFLNYKTIYWNESHNHELRDYSGWKIKLREYIRSVIFNKIDAFWYGGEWALEMIDKYADSSSKKIFVPNLINEKAFEDALSFTEEQKANIRKKYGISENYINLICPARLTSVKGQLNFFKQFKNYPNASKFCFILAGDGDQEKVIKECVEHSGILNVRLLGYKNQEEIIELYSVSDYFFMPSLSDPNPLTCIESLWCGLPLIVSNHVGNSPEVIKPGVNGYIFNAERLNESYMYFDDIINHRNNDWLLNARKESRRIAHEKYSSLDSTKRIISETLSIF
jgi:glycosyltransferase involved in cell wall biosynthesis